MRSTCPRHGRYTKGCPDCPAYSAAYRSARLKGVKDGTWQLHLTGEQLAEVRQRVLSLLAVPGVSGPRIAAAVGISHHTVYRVASGRPTALDPEIGRALLAVTVGQCKARRVGGDGSRVDATGTARRLRALAADGWDSATLGGLCGVDGRHIGRWRAHYRPTVREAVHERIRELYEKIQSQADPRGPSEGAAIHARRLGYLPPERWADEDLDDPDAEPLPPVPDTEDHEAVTRQIEDALRDPRPGKAAGYPRPVKREIARHAHHRLGWPYQRIADLLGLRSTNAVEYLLHGRKDRPHTRKGKS
jgi:hypothetical protein